MQGYTDAPWRHYHAGLYGGVDIYFTPFIRVERGEVRQRDLKALGSPLNANTRLIPQIIFRDADEFRMLTDSIKEAGYDRIDLNMGCPFPPQVKHGRGAALTARPELLEEISELITTRYADIRFSAKMRPGVADHDDWRKIMPVLNRMPLTHLTVHPRIATQQYSGDLDMEAFAGILAEARHPVIFNGDIRTPGDIDRIREEYPAIAGVMIGRGMSGDPAVAAEWREGTEWPARIWREKLLEFHRLLLEHYTATVSGDGQILIKIKPFWDYLEHVIGHKAAKAIKKANSVAKYHAAVRSIEFQD